MPLHIVISFVYARCTVFYKFFRRLLRLSLIGLLAATATNSAASDKDLFADVDRLSINHLVKAVLHRNPSVEAMRQAWQADEQRIAQVSALDDPMLSYSFAPRTRHLEGSDLGQKIQLSQKIPWPGKLSLKGDSARFQARATAEELELTRLNLMEAAAQAFADWYYIHEALRINDINQDLWKEFHAIAELKYSTGRASKQDALRAEVEQVMLEHQAIVLQRKQHDIKSRINTLLNRSPVEDVPPPGTLYAVRKIPNAQELRQHALAAHPLLKALDAQHRASQAQQSLAERDYYPDFNVTAGYNSLWEQEEKRFTVGVGINIPLGQGKRDARLGESRARARQVQWQISDKQAEIAGAVQSAYNRVEESRHVLALYRDRLLPLADESLHATKTDYESGKGNFLDLVSAEKNLIQTQLNQVQARADYHRHLAMLASRTGDPRFLDSLFLPSVEIEGETP